jgi:hypothetical protein
LGTQLKLLTPVAESIRNVPPLVIAPVGVVVDVVVDDVVTVDVVDVVLVVDVVVVDVAVDVVEEVLPQPASSRLPMMMMVRDRNNSFFIAYFQTSLLILLSRLMTLLLFYTASLPPISVIYCLSGKNYRMSVFSFTYYW